VNGKRFLAISVDDGHPTDLRTAELLRRYGLKATFYVPATNPERPLLSQTELRAIGSDFEIGAHTFGHRPLANLPDADASREIVEGKDWLENQLGHDVRSFCYPRGKFNSRTPERVRQAGLLGARTCMFNLSDVPANPYVVGVSTHASSHPRHVQLRHALLERNFEGARNFITIHRLARDWGRHFVAALDWVDRHGGVAHLYLHSWEIDQHAEWDKLDAVLRSAASYDRLTRVTNGELFRIAHTEAQRASASSRPPPDA